MNILNEKLSDRGLSEKDILEALDPVGNIKKRSVQGGPAPKETKRQVTVIGRKLAGFGEGIKLIRKKITEASVKLEKASLQYS